MTPDRAEIEKIADGIWNVYYNSNKTANIHGMIITALTTQASKHEAEKEALNCLLAKMREDMIETVKNMKAMYCGDGDKRAGHDHACDHFLIALYSLTPSTIKDEIAELKERLAGQIEIGNAESDKFTKEIAEKDKRIKELESVVHPQEIQKHILCQKEIARLRTHAEQMAGALERISAAIDAWDEIPQKGWTESHKNFWVAVGVADRESDAYRQAFPEKE